MIAPTDWSASVPLAVSVRFGREKAAAKKVVGCRHLFRAKKPALIASGTLALQSAPRFVNF